MAIPAGPRLIVLAASYEAFSVPGDDERLRLPLSRISAIRARHALPNRVAVSNDHARFPGDRARRRVKIVE